MSGGTIHTVARTQARFLHAVALCTIALFALCPVVDAIGFQPTLAHAEEADATTDKTADEAEYLELTQADRDLVARTGTLVVGLLMDRTPMSYEGDNGEPVGVTRDVLDRISQDTGLTFSYVALDSYGSIEDQIRDLGIDIVAGIEPVSSSIGSVNLAPSSSYCSTRATVAFNAAYGYRDLDENMTFAVTSERASTYEALGYDVLACPTVEACLKAVDRGEADYTYGSSHVVSYLLNRSPYDNVRVVDATVQTVESTLALVEPADGELLDLLNRAIASIEPVDVIDMVYVHTYLRQNVTLRELATRHPGIVAGVVSIPLLAIAVALGIVALTRSRAANRDPLTQAYNATAFRRRVSKRLRTTSGTAKQCLIIVDVDDFKSVNDRFGHFEGDQVLKSIATALREASAPQGFAARMGGDEFLAYWESGDVAALQRRAEEAAESITKRIAEQAPAVSERVTVSVGGACWHDGEPYDNLYRRADEALYRVKRSGKGAATIEA